MKVADVDQQDTLSTNVDNVKLLTNEDVREIKICQYWDCLRQSYNERLKSAPMISQQSSSALPGFMSSFKKKKTVFCDLVGREWRIGKIVGTGRSSAVRFAENDNKEVIAVKISRKVSFVFLFTN